MTRVWRLCRRPYAAFDGAGARLAGGRWNPPGLAVVYTSATLSLAALEYFVHLDAADAPTDLVAVSAEIPARLGRDHVAESSLPAGWRRYPAPRRLAEMGARWLQRRRTPVLAVPSALVPAERNYLLNPAHPDFARIRVARPEPFAFDSRMWRR